MHRQLVLWFVSLSLASCTFCDIVTLLCILRSAVVWPTFLCCLLHSVDLRPRHVYAFLHFDTLSRLRFSAFCGRAISMHFVVLLTRYASLCSAVVSSCYVLRSCTLRCCGLGLAVLSRSEFSATPRCILCAVSDVPGLVTLTDTSLSLFFCLTLSVLI